MNHQRIIPAVVEDCAEILALQKMAFLQQAALYNDYSLPPLVETVESIRAEFQTATFLKVVFDGRIIGSVRFRAAGEVLDVGRLIVHPEHQKQGLGARLLKSVESHGRGAVKARLFTGALSEANIRLYSRHGYKVVGQEKLQSGIVLLYMEKELVDR